MIPKFASSDRTSEKKNENEHQDAQKAQNPQYAICNLLVHTMLVSRRIRRKKSEQTSERPEPSVSPVVTQVPFPLPAGRLEDPSVEKKTKITSAPRRKPSTPQHPRSSPSTQPLAVPRDTSLGCPNCLRAPFLLQGPEPPGIAHRVIAFSLSPLGEPKARLGGIQGEGEFRQSRRWFAVSSTPNQKGFDFSETTWNIGAGNLQVVARG